MGGTFAMASGFCSRWFIPAITQITLTHRKASRQSSLNMACGSNSSEANAKRLASLIPMLAATNTSLSGSLTFLNRNLWYRRQLKQPVMCLFNSFGVWSRSIFVTTVITLLTPLKKIYQKPFTLFTFIQSEDGSTRCFSGLKLTGWALGHMKLRFRSKNSVPQSTNHTDAFPKVLQVHLISVQ